MNSSDKQTRLQKKKAKLSIASFLSKIRGRKRKRREVKEEDLDRNLVYSLSTRAIPDRHQVKYLGKFISRKERTIINICLIVLVIALGYLVVNFLSRHLSATPAYGGTYTEGVVGYPKYINPLYSENRDVDQDIARLVFSSLFTHDSSGHIIGDLAQSWTQSEDHKEYTIELKQSAKWHNGEPLDADDIIFTFSLVKDQEYNSSLRKQLSGIEMEKVDDHTLKVKLSEAYAGVLDLLDFFIMPESVWTAATPASITLSELNIRPIGSGPYRFKDLVKNRDGEIKEYTLEANADYYGKAPYIKQITFKFYADEQSAIGALNSHHIDGVSYVSSSNLSSVMVKNSLEFHYFPIAQVNSLFFNAEKNSYLGDKEIRAALQKAISRDALIEAIGSGHYIANASPLPASSYAYKAQDMGGYDLTAAKQILADEGWEIFPISQETVNSYDSLEQYGLEKLVIDSAKQKGFDPLGDWLIKKPAKEKQAPEILSITLSYVSGSENQAAAESIKSSFESLGIRTSIKSISASELDQASKTANFEVILAGQFVGHDPDISVFWHSTQIGQGPNVARYKNTEVDAKLISARSSFDEAQRIALYGEIQDAIAADAPAIFLYTPTYAYAVTKQVKGIEGKEIAEPADRFSDITKWYIKTKKNFQL